MNTTLRWVLGIAAGLLIAAVLFSAGAAIGQTIAVRQRVAANPYAYGMMGGYGQPNAGNVPYGMMNGGMMGSYGDGSAPYGMMGGSGMMGGYNAGGLANVEPLSVEEARSAIETYLTALGSDDLELAEVIIFDNQAYGLIVERSTGLGAMEVLVDPVTQAVYPEPGPNMMWNLKYSPTGYGMMGGSGVMGGGRNTPDETAEMTISQDEAVEAAQRYLDAYLPGTTVADEADTFYGYYTLEVLRDGQIAGMLSVNGFSGQVFPHTWHGEFVEMSEAGEE